MLLCKWIVSDKLSAPKHCGTYYQSPRGAKQASQCWPPAHPGSWLQRALPTLFVERVVLVSWNVHSLAPPRSLSRQSSWCFGALLIFNDLQPPAPGKLLNLGSFPAALLIWNLASKQNPLFVFRIIFIIWLQTESTEWGGDFTEMRTSTPLVGLLTGLRPSLWCYKRTLLKSCKENSHLHCIDGSNSLSGPHLSEQKVFHSSESQGSGAPLSRVTYCKTADVSIWKTSFT